MDFYYHYILFLGLGCTNLNAQDKKGKADGKSTPPSVSQEHEVETLVDDVLLSIGFNLNLIATTQTSGLYYDVNTFIPSLGGDSKIGKNLGFDLRLNQGAFIPKSYGEMERTSFFRINAVTNENVISILQQDHIDAT